MQRSLALLIVLPLVSLSAADWAAAQSCPPPEALTCAPPEAPSWIFRPSAYSHDATTGARVNQFQPEKPAYAREDPTYRESGYRHYHVAIPGANGTYDHTHIVQAWGAGELIRPYGEWEFPYRAGATPFGPWGNPQGPWTLPFESWVNPYGLGKLPNPPWPYWPNSGPYQGPAGSSPYSSPAAPYQAPPGPHAHLPNDGPHQPPWGPQPPSPYGGTPSPPPVPQL